MPPSSFARIGVLVISAGMGNGREHQLQILPVGKARRVVLNRVLVGRLRSLSLGATAGVIETAKPKSRKARSSLAASVTPKRQEIPE